MIHYHLWFRLKDTASEPDALAIVRRFLSELHAAGTISDFRLLENTAQSPKTQLLRFHALIMFASDAQFSAAFATQLAQGIHTGLHGQAMALVDAFQIEVFRELPPSVAPGASVERRGDHLV